MFDIYIICTHKDYCYVICKLCTYLGDVIMYVAHDLFHFFGGDLLAWHYNLCTFFCFSTSSLVQKSICFTLGGEWVFGGGGQIDMYGIH